jgi:hypothetical protein
MEVSENVDEKKLPMFVIAHVRGPKHQLREKLSKWRPFDKQLGELLLELEDMVRQMSANSPYKSELASGFFIVPYTIFRKENFSEVEQKRIRDFGISMCLCDGKCLICAEPDCLHVRSIVFLLRDPDPHYRVIINEEILGANKQKAKNTFLQLTCTRTKWVEDEKQLKNDLYWHLIYGLDVVNWKYVDILGASWAREKNG